MKHLLNTIGIAALACGAFAQAPAPAAKASAPAPKAADGHPDLTGVWWRGEDVGGRTGAFSRNTTPVPAYSSLYNAAAQARAKTLTDKDDPTLRCQSTAFGTLNVSMFDVGGPGQRRAHGRRPLRSRGRSAGEEGGEGEECGDAAGHGGYIPGGVKRPSCAVQPPSTNRMVPVM